MVYEISFLVEIGKSIWITFFLLGTSYVLAEKVVAGKSSAIILLFGAFEPAGFGEAILNPPFGAAARGGVHK
jgi:hypothetical protein